MNGPANRWLPCTLSASYAAKTSRIHLAPLFWQKAYAFSLQLPADDPRRASALHNAGFAHLIRGDRQTSLELFGGARRQWQRAEAWVRSADIPLTGHSSSFHMLLAAKNSEALLRLRRETYLKLCNGAASITEALSQHLESDANSHDDAPKHVRALRDAFGDECPEARALELLASRLAPDSLPITQPSLDDRWRGLFRSTPTEIRPLIDAVYLTAGLHPNHLPWLRQAMDNGAEGIGACRNSQRNRI
jgi:hypothetical protein